ncbi:MAG: hypothetical protein WD357_01980 [Gracilimonas sp.]
MKRTTEGSPFHATEPHQPDPSLRMRFIQDNRLRGILHSRPPAGGPTFPK